MKYALTCLFIVVCFSLRAQTQTDTIAKATEFSIPQSGAFSLLGNTPANVNMPGFTKDIHLDYFLNEFSLKPNLAFEFQPFWLFGFQHTTLEDYRKKSPVLRFLSTSSVSVGTVQVNDTLNKIGYSIKFSFAKDPMMDTAYINAIDRILQRSVRNREETDLEISRKRFMLKRDIRRLEAAAVNEADLSKKELIRDTIVGKEAELVDLQIQLNELDVSHNEQLKEEVKEYAKSYIEKNWYRPKLDIGLGKVDSYTNPSLSAIDLKQNGFGFWANASIGFIPRSNGVDEAKNNKILLTGIYRYVKADDIKENFYGGNIRYGSSKLNLFAEYTFLDDDIIKTQTIAYGGSYKIGSKKLVEFGIRTNYDEDFNFKNLRPVISFNWEFGKDILK